MSEHGLTPESSLVEVFKYIQPEEGMRVIPTQVPAEEGKANLAILISGNEAEANVVMANLMHYVQEMHDVSQQKEADSEIVGTDGEPIQDEPSIIVR